MVEALPRKETHESAEKQRDWRKSASDHVAYALLVYTALQIFGTVHAMKSATTGSITILPYLALVLLVAGIIPACRWFEKRWSSMTDEQAHDPAYAGSFRKDILILWALAIGLPVVMTVIFTLIAAAA